MALTVQISGTTDIEQGEQTTLTAAVTDSGGNTPVGTLSYAWTATRGSFPNGATGASVVYEADFTESSDVDVDITCAVTRAADASPTVSTGSLTAMTNLGITGQILNMYIDETENSANGSSTVLYAEGSSDSSLETGSDDDISSDLHIWRVQWREDRDWLILNDNGTGDLSAFFSSNTAQSLYLIFSDGTHYEVTQSLYDNGGADWSRWTITDATINPKLDALGADDTLLLGVGDAGSIGIAADSGSGTTQVTAATATVQPLSIEAIAHQMIVIGTQDYDLEIDIGGNPDSVKPTGDLEGFSHEWDAANDTLHIRSVEVERLIADATWTILLTKGTETLTGTITFSVIQSAPIIVDPGDLVFYRGESDPDLNNGNYQFIEIENSPSLIRTTADLLGLKDEPATEGTPDTDSYREGVAITGDIDATATFGVSTYACDLFASNDGGEDTLNAIPVLITGPNPPADFETTSDGAGLHATWTASTIGTPILDYRIRINGGAWVTVTGTSHTFSDVERDTAYTLDLQSRNATGYSRSVSLTVTHEVNAFLWVASGEVIYRLDAETLALAESPNQIDVTGFSVHDITYHDGNLYAHVRTGGNHRILRINTTSGSITQNLAASDYGGSDANFGDGIAYEVQSGDDAIWYFNVPTNSNVSADYIYKSQPPGTDLNSRIQNALPAGRDPREVVAMEYYDSGLWLIYWEVTNRILYKITDNLPSGSDQNQNGTVESTTTLLDADNNPITPRGVAIGGNFVWLAATDGTLHKLNLSDLSHDSATDISATGATSPLGIAYYEE